MPSISCCCNILHLNTFDIAATKVGSICPSLTPLLQFPELPIDPRPDLLNTLSLLVQARRFQRLLEAEVSRARVSVRVAGEEARVAHVLLALTVAMELVQDVRNLLRDLMSPCCLPDEASGGQGGPRLLPGVGHL